MLDPPLTYRAYTNTLPDYWYQDDVLCILAGIYKLISKTVPIIDFYDNVGLYNDVVIRAYNTDVLVIKGWQ